MKPLILLRLVVFSFVLVYVSGSCQSQKDSVESTAVLENRSVHPWFIYKEGSSFKEIEPYKDLIYSLSVFGEPSKNFIDQCHQNGIEVYRAVSGNESTIDTPEKRESVVNDYVKECDTKGYDGIDLDFEHLDAEFQSTYSEFLNLAAERLHKIGKKLSHCVGFYPTLYEDKHAKTFYHPEVLAKTCDLIRVMCYDMYFAPAIGDELLNHREDCMGIGPTSSYPWVKDAMEYWLSQIPSQKLVMALPTYGNDYAITCEPLKGRQIYAMLPDSVKGILPTAIWNYYHKLNIYLYDGEDGYKHIFYASDASSTQELLKLAQELGIDRIGFWHFNSVSSDMWEEARVWKKKNEN